MYNGPWICRCNDDFLWLRAPNDSIIILTLMDLHGSRVKNSSSLTLLSHEDSSFLTWSSHDDSSSIKIRLIEGSGRSSKTPPPSPQASS